MPRLRKVEIEEEMAEERRTLDEIRYGTSDPRRLAKAKEAEAKETTEILRTIQELRDQEDDDEQMMLAIEAETGWEDDPAFDLDDHDSSGFEDDY